MKEILHVASGLEYGPRRLKYYNVILQHQFYNVPYLSFNISYIILLAYFRQIHSKYMSQR